MDSAGTEKWSFRFGGSDLHLYNHNGAPVSAVAFALGTNVATFNQRPFWDASGIAVAGDNLDYFNDVSYTPGLTANDVMTWSGSAWEPQPPVGGSLELVDLTDVTDGHGTTAGWFLRTSGANWVAQSGIAIGDITGSINADSLGGLGAAGYAAIDDNETITGSWTFADNDINVINGSDAGWIDYKYGGSTTVDKVVWARILDGTTERWGWRYDVADNTDDLYLVKLGSTEVMRFDYSANLVSFPTRPKVGSTDVALTTDTPTLGALSTHSDVGTDYAAGDILWNSSGTWLGRTAAELGIVEDTDISVQQNSTHRGYLGPNDINFINGTNTTVVVADAGAALTVRVNASISTLTSTTGVDIDINTDGGSDPFRVRTTATPTPILTLTSAGDMTIDGDLIGGDAATGTRWTCYNSGYATFGASNSGDNVQLEVGATNDYFYLYNGTSRNYITPLYGFSTGTGGPGSVAANYGAIYLRYNV